MELKLKYSESDCCSKSFSRTLRREESREAVVPDTMPDIADILFCSGRVLIRSKELREGRLSLEAAVPAAVVFRGENGDICSLPLELGFYMSIDEAELPADGLAAAELCLVNLDARALNPRKILLRGELETELSCYEKSKLCLAEGVEGDETVCLRRVKSRVSLRCNLVEKSFALAAEAELPPSPAAKEIVCAEMETAVDELKTVGSKLIVRGRVKSRVVYLDEAAQLRTVCPVTEFSQIIETGCAGENTFARVWLIPSGAEYRLIPRGDGEALDIELHMVAQAECFRNDDIVTISDAYSNNYELDARFETRHFSEISPSFCLRAELRRLYESPRTAAEISIVGCRQGSLRLTEEGLCLPVIADMVCSGSDGSVWGETRSAELCFRCSMAEGAALPECVEITEINAFPVAGGIELRAAGKLELRRSADTEKCCLVSLAYDENTALDNSDRPSIVLLRACDGDDIWALARENCSTIEAISAANGLDEAGEGWKKLILIPKVC